MDFFDLFDFFFSVVTVGAVLLVGGLVTSLGVGEAEGVAEPVDVVMVIVVVVVVDEEESSLLSCNTTGKEGCSVGSRVGSRVGWLEGASAVVTAEVETAGVGRRVATAGTVTGARVGDGEG